MGQGTRSPVREVLLASFEKLHPEARSICAQFLSSLMEASVWDQGPVVSRSFRKLQRDDEFLDDYALDVPHVREYLSELEVSLKHHGLLEGCKLSPAVALDSDEDICDLEIDPDRHWFYFPSGQHFSLPADWQVRKAVEEN